jgi:hypothetical protein
VSLIFDVRQRENTMRYILLLFLSVSISAASTEIKATHSENGDQHTITYSQGEELVLRKLWNPNSKQVMFTLHWKSDLVASYVTDPAGHPLFLRTFRSFPTLSFRIDEFNVPPRNFVLLQDRNDGTYTLFALEGSDMFPVSGPILNKPDGSRMSADEVYFMIRNSPGQFLGFQFQNEN